MDASNLKLDGSVLRPGDAGYEEALPVWNAMIDRRPAWIVRPASTADVAAAVRYAQEHELDLAIRGGGHNVAGLGTCDGMVIDLSQMRTVSVDIDRRTVRVGGGALWRDVDQGTHPHRLAVPSGIISSTGVGGLTLGGGIGWLARRHGLTCDNLVEAEVVCADGRVLIASETEHPDLFWGLRGGGGNFGVVTAFTFKLHDVGGDVLFGPTVYALDDAEAVLRAYRDFSAGAPRDCCVWVDLLTAPPLPFLPEPVHGTRVVSILQMYVGDPAEGERTLAPLHSAAPPLGSGCILRPYVDAQCLADEAYTAGKRNYWTSHNVQELSDAAIYDLVQAAATLPTPMSDILISQLGGAIDDPSLDATAYPHRGAAFAITPGARWDDPGDDARCVAWARACHRALATHARGTAYSNFIGERSGAEADAYGAHLARLREIKRRYDPDNVFRNNQNIRP
jgi:FAD/FMN-containing dehydrogenase